MLVQVIVAIDGRQVGLAERELDGLASVIEEDVQHVLQRTGRMILERAFNKVGCETPPSMCCGRKMRSRGRREITVVTLNGPVRVVRRRYQCEECGRADYPADAQLCTGDHRVTRPLAKRVCQLATLEHFPQLPGLVMDQHGVGLRHDLILQLVHDVGTTADQGRRADAEHVLDRAPLAAREIQPEFRPRRVYVSCDGIMYCTNQLEPVPGQPEVNRLIWQQMKVGAVYWQDAKGNWNKQMIWGREGPREFGAALFELACRCGYREAAEKIFAADGGAWCWDIRALYFSDAQGILDWYHASEHVWAAARAAMPTADVKAWVDEALGQLHDAGGVGLARWLSQQICGRRGKARQALSDLLAYVEPRSLLMNYPMYRARDMQIGTGMIESTCKQLVAQRLKGAGMHWTEQGAIAVAALRATDLNQKWHQFWKNLNLAT